MENKTKEYYYESVRAGHPDKLCDYISDSVLDAFIKVDKNAHVACECFVAGRNLIVGGEISSTGDIDIKEVAVTALKDKGYLPEEFNIQVLVSKQSSEINKLVSGNEELGAGDQGVVIGYACNEEGYLPLGFLYIQKLMKHIDEIYKFKEELRGMKPDGKGFISQHNGKLRVHFSYEAEDDGFTDVRQNFLEYEIRDLAAKWGLPSIDEVTFIEYYVGGPTADTGLTGRKLAVDTYGGIAPIGGGCLSGKDGTKVDRTGAYLARQIAISVIDKVNAEEVTVWLGYAIGEPRPVSVKLEVKGYDGSVCELENGISEKLQESDFSLNKLIENYYQGYFKFRNLSAYGHFMGYQHYWEKPFGF